MPAVFENEAGDGGRRVSGYQVDLRQRAILVADALDQALNWLQTPFFFDVLHMHYGFHATWTHDRNPLFLYLVTIPYFATYSVLACMAYRFVTRLPLPRAASWIAIRRGRAGNRHGAV